MLLVDHREAFVISGHLKTGTIEAGMNVLVDNLSFEVASVEAVDHKDLSLLALVINTCSKGIAVITEMFHKGQVLLIK